MIGKAPQSFEVHIRSSSGFTKGETVELSAGGSSITYRQGGVAMTSHGLPLSVNPDDGGKIRAKAGSHTADVPVKSLISAIPSPVTLKLGDKTVDLGARMRMMM